MANIPSNYMQDNQASLDFLYESQKSRDASSSIRGFIFQDLVALEYLLENDTDSVALECIEDVDVFRTDGTMLIIQAKYYPESNLDIPGITSDLYYQYLCMDLLNQIGQCIPVLVTHHSPAVKKPDLEKIKTYILSAASPATSFPQQKPSFPGNPQKWLEDNVTSKKKRAQKQTLLKAYAYGDSIKNFSKNLKIENRQPLVSFEKDVAEKLKQALQSYGCKPSIGRKNLPDLLIGVGLHSLRKRYTAPQATSQLEKNAIHKKSFIDNVVNTLRFNDEERLASYLIGLLTRTYAEILSRNSDLSVGRQMLLGEVLNQTQNWLCELTTTTQGQFQLINTVSREMNDELSDFKELDFANRFELIIESSDGIKKFCKYLWKIILDLCLEQNPDIEIQIEETPAKLSEYINLLNPLKYVLTDGYDYICLSFDYDYVDTGVLLPETGNDEAAHNITTYYDRFSSMGDQRPQKWYMRGMQRGPRTYRINPARIPDKHSISDIDSDSDTFYIECMECIHIDDRQWNCTETCSNCIFKLKCIHDNKNCIEEASSK